MSEGLSVTEEAATQLCFGEKKAFPSRREQIGFRQWERHHPSTEAFPKYNSMAAVILREPEVALHRGATQSDTHFCKGI